MDRDGAAQAREHAGGGENAILDPENDFADAGETLDEAFLFGWIEGRHARSAGA